MLRNLLANRWLHSLVLTVFVVALTFTLLELLSPVLALLAGLTPVAAWMLGQKYERAVLIGAGLVDEEDAAAAERDAASFFSRR